MHFSKLPLILVQRSMHSTVRLSLSLAEKGAIHKRHHSRGGGFVKLFFLEKSDFLNFWFVELYYDFSQLTFTNFVWEITLKLYAYCEITLIGWTMNIHLQKWSDFNCTLHDYENFLNPFYSWRPAKNCLNLVKNLLYSTFL